MTLKHIKCLDLYQCQGFLPLPSGARDFMGGIRFRKKFSPLVPSANPEVSPPHYIVAHEQKSSLLTKVIFPQRSQTVMRKL